MPKENFIKVNVTEENSILQISPRLPILSSQKASWDGIQIGHYQQPAYETPEHIFSQHLISIHINSPVMKEQVLNGHIRRECFVDGDICITPAGTPVAVRFNNPCEFALLHLEPTFINRALSELVDIDDLEVVPQFKLCDPLIYQIGVALKAELESGGLGSRLYAESAATFLTTHLLRHYLARKHTIRDFVGGLPKHKLRLAIAYIHEHLEQELSLIEIATVVQMSPYHFSRLFKQSTGLTPHQYVTRYRIEKAKLLLARGELAIADISQEVGFQSQSHFTTIFRRLMGVTPKAYRRAL